MGKKYVTKYNECNVPIFSWINPNEIEESAIIQLKNCASLPFAFHHVAVMPDVHAGMGIAIGTVLATKNVIVPNAVGVDIGCGMIFQRTNLKNLSVDCIKQIMDAIREVIPLGFEHHKEKQDNNLMPFSQYDYKSSEFKKMYPIVSRQYNKALYSLATLGGGNHFWELQKDSNGFICIMIHSGSRNLGKQVADYYNDIAKTINRKWYSSIPEEYNLAFLPVECEEGKSYIREMNYCVDFAYANRKLMMDRTIKIIFNIVNSEKLSILNGDIINIAHNYAKWEHHFGKNVIVHRKGATLATKDTIGIIPGSLGSHSYIVQGLGNPESFYSCSHGAGRKMGRNVAKKTLNLEEEIKILNDQGIIHGIRTEENLDEATGSYKNIEDVMNSQKDLVNIIDTLTPIASIKG